MKHFVKKHTHHFGLWALSGLLLIWSSIWLNNLNKQTAQSAPISETAEMKSQGILPPDNIGGQNDNKIALPPILSGTRSDSKEQNNNPPAPSPAPQLANTESTPAVSAPVTSSAPEKQTISVTFQIITPAATKEFSIQIPPQSTVYDAMKKLPIPVKFKDFGGLGAFVEAIDGLTNDSKANLFWIYYINNETAKLGVSSIKLNPNDIITWRYEQGNL